MNIQPPGNLTQAASPWGDRLAEAASLIVPGQQIAVAAIQQSDPAPTLPQVQQAIQNINKTLQVLAPNLEFSVDTESHRTIVRVIDQQTKELIRQMPSTEALEIAKALDRVQGLLIRQKV